MEYGLHDSLKIYSGGLGLLAGDYLKEASDMKVNLKCSWFALPVWLFQTDT
jgi:glucan phosphorylase